MSAMMKSTVLVVVLVLCVECRRNCAADSSLSQDVKDILSEQKRDFMTKLEQTSKQLREEMEKQINELRENISGIIQEVTDLRSRLDDSVLDEQASNVTVGYVEGAVTKVSNNCPNGWFKIGRKCYIISQFEQTWFNAFEICQTVGGRLAEPDNADLLAFSLMPYSSRETWLGGDDRDHEGSWKWSTSNRTLSTYDSKWYPERPDGSGDCLVRYTYMNVQLGDESCWEDHYFACEMTLDSS